MKPITPGEMEVIMSKHPIKHAKMQGALLELSWPNARYMRLVHLHLCMHIKSNCTSISAG